MAIALSAKAALSQGDHSNPQRLPITISIDEPVKINGQSLNAMNAFLYPVNNETSESAFKAPNDVQYTPRETRLFGSRYVTSAMRTPMNMRATPSVIHSIVMMRLLSSEISPKAETTFRVGNKWAMPQPNVKNEPA